jgi:hypothetical protein
MGEISETTKPAGIPIAAPFFYGWFIVAFSGFASRTNDRQISDLKF